MFKAMILLKRKEQLSHREFKNWWIGEHARLAIQLPGLKLAIGQVVVASVDLVVVSLVLWVLLPEQLNVSYPVLLSGFLLAILVATFSQIPSGLGVFELTVLSFVAPGAPPCVQELCHFVAPVAPVIGPEYCTSGVPQKYYCGTPNAAHNHFLCCTCFTAKCTINI